jgi:F-type H+-transporting ATPase subunit gamma
MCRSIKYASSKNLPDENGTTTPGCAGRIPQRQTRRRQPRQNERTGSGLTGQYTKSNDFDNWGIDELLASGFSIHHSSNQNSTFKTYGRWFKRSTRTDQVGHFDAADHEGHENGIGGQAAEGAKCHRAGAPVRRSAQPYVVQHPVEPRWRRRPVFGKAREVKNALVVVVTSNRGLVRRVQHEYQCKEATALITEKYGKQRREGHVSMLFIGKKGFDYFRRRFRDINFIEDFIPVYDNPSYDNVSAVARGRMEEFSTGKYDAIEIVYSRFKNAATVFPTAEQWLPVPKMEVPAGTKTKKADYIFEPDEQQLLETLVPSILQLAFHKCVLDTQASEHGSRMTAMDKATENAEELLKSLKIHYNKKRQEAITTELGEIVSGAAALEN